MPSRIHQFYAIAFVENLTLKGLTIHYPEARASPHELYFPIDDGAGVYIYPFGAMVFHNVPQQRRDLELTRLEQAHPGLDRKSVV